MARSARKSTSRKSTARKATGTRKSTGRKATGTRKSTGTRRSTARKSTATRKSADPRKPAEGQSQSAAKVPARKGTASQTQRPKKKRSKTPSQAPKRSRGSGFVISPFGGWFDSYYELIYKPAVEAAGMTPRRADDLYRPSSIVNDIWAFVRGSRVLLADLTDKNPNVLYELGLAHAIGKPVILLTQNIEDVPFDLRPLRVIEYDVQDPAWSDLLRDKLESAIKEVLSSPQQAVPATFLKEKQTKTPSVSRDEKRIRELEQQVAALRTRQERPPSSNLSTQGTLALIRTYVDAGLDDQEILTRLGRHNIPTSWALRKIKEIRALPEGRAYRVMTF